MKTIEELKREYLEWIREQFEMELNSYIEDCNYLEAHASEMFSPDHGADYDLNMDSIGEDYYKSIEELRWKCLDRGISENEIDWLRP